VPYATGTIREAIEENYMKRLFGFALILALFSVPAFAGNKSQSVNLAAAATVGSTQLPAGNYKVTWTGSGSSVQVSLTQGKKTIVTVQAKAVEQKNNQTGVTTDTQGGVSVLRSIQLDSVSLVLQDAQASGQ